MKLKKLMIPLLLTGILLAGCSPKKEDAAMLEEKTSVNEEGTEFSTTEEILSTEGTALTEDNASENTETEPYILTFEAETTEGEKITSECFTNSKITMINIWATYCNPCLSEMPDLGEIAAAYDTSEFQLIGIVSDVAEGDSEDNIAYAKELILETNANYPHLLLSQSLYSNLVGAVSSVPTTFFVNQHGEVLGYITGAMDKASWEEIINGLLEETK